MKLLFRIFLALSVSILCINSAVAGGAESPEELASSVHQAILDKDSEAISALYNWQGVEPDIKALLNDAIEYMLEEPVHKAKVGPVPDDFHEVQEMGGKRFKQNLKVEGEVLLVYSLEDESLTASMLYGADNGRYYFTAPVSE